MTMSLATFSAGRRVYNGGSYAPTRGPVSAQGAQGYFNREMRNQRGVSQTGRDGQSDTRSGGANRIAARRAATGGSGSGGRPPVGPPRTPVRQPPRVPGSGNPVVPGPGGNPTTPPAGGPGGGAVVVPEVTINDAGTIELPYNAEWMGSVLDSLGQYNQQLLELQMEGQQGNLQYARNKRDTELGYVETKRNNLSGNSAAGTAYSSQYATDVTESAQDYTTKINDLDLDNSMLNSSIGIRRAAIVAALKDQLRRAAMDYANDTAEDAGDLGYGVTPPPPSGGNTNTPNAPSTQKHTFAPKASAPGSCRKCGAAKKNWKHN